MSDYRILTHDEKVDVYEAMLQYGGSFSVAIGQALIVADHNNELRLCMAFPELIEQYFNMAYPKKKEASDNTGT